MLNAVSMRSQRRMFVFSFVLLICFSMVLAPSMFSQSASTGAISGTLKDSSGASVPNATVTLTSLETNQSRTTTTTADGTYRFGFLNSGAYKLRFEAAGFSSVDVPSITVIVTQTSVLDQTLQVGAQTQQVEVTGEAEEVDTASSTVGTVVAGGSLAALPLTTRNYTTLLGLSAGSNVAVYNAALMGRGTQDPVVNGALAAQNNYQMDGESINNTAGTGTGADSGGATTGMGVVNPDSIQEFKIQTSAFDASYGRNSGANVNVVTKSGTNGYHGTAFEFFRNTVLNANDFFRSENAPPLPNSRPILNQNQFGGSFGGPVKKDKLFFFASYQRTWQKNGAAAAGFAAPTLVGIPTSWNANGTPNGPITDRNDPTFAAALGLAFCLPGTPGFPTAGYADVGSGPTTKTKNGGIQVACDGSNINQVALNILRLKTPGSAGVNGYYVPGSSNGQFQKVSFSSPAHYFENQGVGNFDYVINSKNTFSGRYFYSATETDGTIGVGTTSATVTQGLPGSPGSVRFPTMYMVAKVTSLVSSNLVNEVRAALQRSVVYDYPGFVNADGSLVTNTQLGVTPVEPTYDVSNRFTIQGLMAIGTGVAVARKLNTSWEIGDNISWSHGKHTIRSGFEFERDRLNWYFPALAGGGNANQTYGTWQDFLLGRPGCTPGDVACTAATPTTTKQCPTCAAVPNNGSAFSNILNGGTSVSLTAPGGDNHFFRTPAASAFVQDDFKVSNSLTLNLGVRWEYYGLFYDSLGNLTNVWPSSIAAVNCPLALGACPSGTGVGTTAATGTLAGFVVPGNFNSSLYPATTLPGLTMTGHKVEFQNNAPRDAFAPRLGFAWKPLKTDRFVVRGGAGVFYDRAGIAAFNSSAVQNFPYAVPVFQASGTANYAASNAINYPTAIGATLGWSGASRWFNIANPLTPTALGSGPLLNVIVADPTYQVPTTYQWNLNTQYEFLPTWVLEVGYVGSHSIHQLIQSTTGTTGQTYINLPALASQANPVNGFVTNTTTNANYRVPYLGFGPEGLAEQGNLGKTLFDSLQVTVRKQLAHGLTMQAAYTWSRALTTADHFFYNNPAVENYAPSTQYRPQRLTVSYGYDLPFGHHDGLVGKFVNGWNLSGVTIIQDGLPLTVVNSTGGAVYGANGTSQTSTAVFAPGMGVANIPASGNDKQRISGWFNTAAFIKTVPNVGASTVTIGGVTTTDPGASGWGNSGIGNILGPGQFNFDASIVKTTVVGGIHENATLVFRTEFFNVWNHAQFNAPSGSQLDVSNGSFGQLSTTSVNPRLIQFALKYIF